MSRHIAVSVRRILALRALSSGSELPNEAMRWKRVRNQFFGGFIGFKYFRGWVYSGRRFLVGCGSILASGWSTVNLAIAPFRTL